MKNIADSVRARLMNLFRASGTDLPTLMERFAIGRLLWRLSHGDTDRQFVLKGAQLFSVWQESPHRPTRDLDLLSYGDSTVEGLKQFFEELLAKPADPDDGLLWGEVKASLIRADKEYEGVRINVKAVLAKASVPVQIDIGFGDAITPAPLELAWRELLDFPAARLLTYPPETVIAEKLNAAVELGISNSRMKDFFDLDSLNGFPEKDIRSRLKASGYRLLVVANKFLTGFDEPLLHTMYVDKKLQGVLAVQTLSRLNRCNPKMAKQNTFILDFYNSAAEIKDAFDPFYTATSLSEPTDINVLHDLKDELDEAEVYNQDDVGRFNEAFFKKAPPEQLHPIIDHCVAHFDLIEDEEDKIDFKIKAKQFVKIYGQLACIIPFENLNWEKLHWFLKFLVRPGCLCHGARSPKPQRARSPRRRRRTRAARRHHRRLQRTLVQRLERHAGRAARETGEHRRAREGKP